MTLDELTQAIRAKARQNVPLGHKVAFDLGETGTIFWDGTASPAEIGNEPGEAETTLRLSPDLLEKMIDGNANATMAYMTGKLKISGSMGVAMKINSLLEE